MCASDGALGGSVELVLVDCCNSYNVFVNGNWRMLLNTTDGSRERYTIASNLNPSLQYLIEVPRGRYAAMIIERRKRPPTSRSITR